MLTKENLNEALADAVMDRPREFFIDEERFCLWSPSLGQSMMIGRHLERFEVDGMVLKVNPALAALRIIEKHRDEVCRILAILSMRSRDSLCDSKAIQNRASHFSDKLDNDELAQLLLLVMSEPRVDDFIALSGLKEEHDEQARIAALKNKDGHTLSFGGKTIYGTLIDAACRAYGWSKEYVVWGIDLASLKMMLADAVNSVYISDKEAEELHLGKESAQVFGMSKDDFDKLKSMDWD